jgi:hypothetical protein
MKIKKILLSITFLFLPCFLSAQTTFDASELTKFLGEDIDDYTGRAVSSAGDINNDGYYDLLISAMSDDDGGSLSGSTYLFYGQDDAFSGDIDLSTADAKFIGEDEADLSGFSLSSAGDINNDGYDDFLIGAYGDDDNGSATGSAYLIYGQAEEFSGTIDLSEVDAKFYGENGGDFVSLGISAAGYVNNDDYADFIIGASGDDTGGDSAGAVYLIYGQNTRYSGAIELSAADAKFIGEDTDDWAGEYVGSAGDVNNDGYDDLLISATGDDAGGADAGAVYLVYGQTADFSGNIDLSEADAKFIGEEASDYAGQAVDTTQDANNDNYDDFLIGAPNNDAGGSNAGAVYLVYGQSTAFDSLVDLSAADVKFIGEDAGDGAGSDVSFAGDINNDGYDDLLIAAQSDDDGGSNSGSIYLIKGQVENYPSTYDLSLANYKFTGEESADYAGRSVAGAGDVNNDNYDDIIFGATENDEGASNAGSAYLGYLYIDNDNDGLAGNNGLLTGLDANDDDHDNDGSETGTDCNDDDASISTNQTYFTDLDGDGLGNVASVTSVCSLTVPAGYVTDSTDTNDNDHDNDGSETGTDCNDDDANISVNQTYYQDADGDGLGNSLVTTSLCSLTLPTGYVANANDTDDTIINNNVEIAGDNIDNDGDGLIDEANNRVNLHPQYSVYNPLDEDLYSNAIMSVRGYKRGNVKVKYADNSIYIYSVSDIPTFIHKTQIKQYQNTGYYLILNPHGRLMTLINIYNGNNLSRKTLSAKKSYKYNSFDIYSVNNKKYVVITSKTKNKTVVRLASVKFNITSEKLGAIKKVVMKGSDMMITQTSINAKDMIQLKDKEGKVIKSFIITKKGALIEN